MRLAHVRAAVLSLLAGGFLTLGVLAGWPGAARAGTVKASAASPSASTSARASTTASTSTSRQREHRHQVRGTADGEHADATPIDLQPDGVVTVTVAFRLVHVGFPLSDRLSDRPGVGQHVEQDAGVTPANERDPDPEPGFGLAIIGVGVGFYVGHGLAVPDGFGVRVVVAELSGGHRLRLPRRVHRGEPGQQRR